MSRAAARSRRVVKSRKPSERSKLSAAPQSNITLLPLDEFCKRLGMSKFWGRKQVRLRKIAAVRIGKRRICIPETEVARFIAEHITPAKVAR